MSLLALSVSQLGQGLRRGAFSAEEVTRAALGRIAALDGTLHAFVRVEEDAALAAARAADAELRGGHDRGPLHGIPYATKDIFDVAGLPTTCQSRLRLDHVAAADAAVTARLRAGGAVLLGKLATFEFALGGTSFDLPFPPARNPWNTEHIPGGSSSGSAAAVAAGLLRVATASCTSGSIRGPAAWCGVAGLKPSFGRVSRGGCTPEASSLDCVGPFASDLAGIETAMAMIDPGFRPAPTPKAVRLGWVTTAADPKIAAAVRSALESSGVTVVEVALEGMQEAFEAGIAIMAAEMWELFGALAQDPRMGADVQARIRAAENVTPDQLAAAEAVRVRFRDAVDRVLHDVDAIALPTLPAAPPRLDDLGDPARILGLTALVRPFNLSGHPAISLPIDGPDDQPAAIQLVGPMMADEQLCAIARRVVGGDA